MNRYHARHWITKMIQTKSEQRSTILCCEKKPIEANKRIHINCWKTVKTRQELWLLFKPIQSTNNKYTFESQRRMTFTRRSMVLMIFFKKPNDLTLLCDMPSDKDTKIQRMPLLEHSTCIHRITIERRLDFHSDKTHYMRWFHLIPNTIALFLGNLWSKYLLFFFVNKTYLKRDAWTILLHR